MAIEPESDVNEPLIVVAFVNSFISAILEVIASILAVDKVSCVLNSDILAVIAAILAVARFISVSSVLISSFNRLILAVSAAILAVASVILAALVSISESIRLILDVMAAILAVANVISTSRESNLVAIELDTDVNEPLIVVAFVNSFISATLAVIAAIDAVANVISVSRESNLVAIELDTAVVEPVIIALVVVPNVIPVISPLSISTLVIFWSLKSIAPPAVNAPISSTVSVPSIVVEPVTDKLLLTAIEPVNECKSPTSSPKLLEPLMTAIDELTNVVCTSTAVIVPVDVISPKVTSESVFTGCPRLAVIAAILAVAKVMLAAFVSISESILLTLAVIAAILAVARVIFASFVSVSESNLLILDVMASILAVARVISVSRESNRVATEPDNAVNEPLIVSALVNSFISATLAVIASILAVASVISGEINVPALSVSVTNKFEAET